MAHILGDQYNMAKGTGLLAILNPANWFAAKIKKGPTALNGNWERGGLFTHYYDGEKNLGESGPLKIYRINWEKLRFRSWQSYTESDISQTVLGKYLAWVIGSGLKLQSEPQKKLFELEGITVDAQEFSTNVEAYWDMFNSNKKTDFSKMKILPKIAKLAYKNALLGGDVLVIQRYENNGINIQLVDASHIQSPTGGQEEYKLENGNVICAGVEKDETGMHVAYHVRDCDYNIQRIEARIPGTDMQTAFLVYGFDYRLDSTRGMPILGVILEKLAKLDRYQEATLGSAEERAKIVMYLAHHLNATGDNPLTQLAAKSFDASGTNVPKTDDGKTLADNIAVTTNKQVFNLSPGSELKSVDSKNDLYFKDFFTINIRLVCAALGIPYNVAMDTYDDSYSSSRAAIKSWENTLRIAREDFANQFYKPIFDFWLMTMILKGKIKAPGYLEAFAKNNDDVILAYRKCRFVGTPVPHIDPLKEVQAERLKLGSQGAHLPLTDLEQATENLGGGESFSNMEQFGEELAKAKEFGIEQSITPAIDPNIVDTPITEG